MRVVLSSTLSDLREHRDAVVDVLKGDEFLEVVRAEDQAASEWPPFDEWLAQVRAADWYILLLGWRYGYVPEGQSKSVVELEYDMAKQHVPVVLCFAANEDYPVPSKLVETGENAARLRKFRDRVGRENVVRTFGSPSDLAAKLSEALIPFRTKTFVQGIQDVIDVPELQKQLRTSYEERARHLLTIDELRTRLAALVPAVPIWRSRNFDPDSTLGFCLLPLQDAFLKVFEDAVAPALEGAGLRAVHAGQIFDNREIIEDVWESICRARLVVADVTGRNPNVFYELGICHTLGKEVAVITQSAEDVPFDIRHRRYIQYRVDKMTSLREALLKTVQRILLRGPTP